jgi:acyl dehydratase
VGYDFADFTPGREFDAGRRVVSAADIAAFAELSGDRNALHLDQASAPGAPSTGPIAHGALGVAFGTGLVSQLGLTAGTLIALLELRWRFLAPVRPGDTIQARVRVVERRTTSRPERGIVRLAVDLRNQRNELVQEGELTELIATTTRVGPT